MSNDRHFNYSQLEAITHEFGCPPLGLAHEKHGRRNIPIAIMGGGLTFFSGVDFMIGADKARGKGDDVLYMSLGEKISYPLAKPAKALIIGSPNGHENAISHNKWTIYLRNPKKDEVDVIRGPSYAQPDAPGLILEIVGKPKNRFLRATRIGGPVRYEMPTIEGKEIRQFI